MHPRQQELTPTIDQERAHELFERGAATFVDTRNPAAYARAHLPGSVSAPLLELPRHFGEIPRDRPVITYCA